MKKVKPWEVCEFKGAVDSVGMVAIFLFNKCPYAHHVKEQIVVLKSDCRECEKIRKAKEKGELILPSAVRDRCSKCGEPVRLNVKKCPWCGKKGC